MNYTQVGPLMYRIPVTPEEYIGASPLHSNLFQDCFSVFCETDGAIIRSWILVKDTLSPL